MKGAKTHSISSKESKTMNNKSDLLRGLSICVSGFSFLENQEFKTKIEKLGGKYIENLLVSTHYLIVNKINSSKAICAMKNNIILVTKDWLDEKNEEKYLNYEKCKPGCFYGINLFLFGFNEEESQNMSKTVNQKGGYITKNISDSDIIIVKSSSGYIEEDILKFKKYNHKLVTDNWYNTCLEKNEFQNIDESKDLLNIELINQNYNTIISNIESGQNEKYFQLFVGKIFGIQGFKKDIKSKIFKLISFCDGIISEIILGNMDYIIVPLTFDNSHVIQNKYNTFGQTPKIVTCNWLFDSIKKGKLCEVDSYKPMKSIDLPKETVSSKKILITGTLFKGQTFSIVNTTYEKEDILKIKEKIEGNSGEYFDSGNTINVADFKAKYIILNDGHPDLWNKIINDNKNYEIGKLIISHRYIDKCLRMRKIVDFCDYFDSVPYPFKVPVEEFKNWYFFIPPNQFNFQERLCYEMLIDTLGGNVDDLNKKTTHVIFRKEEISQHTKDKMIKGSNRDVKCICETFFIDYILQCGKCDINNYGVKIKDKK